MVSTAEARVAAPDSPMATFTMAILTMATFGNDHGHPCYGQARVAALDQAVETARQETRDGLRGAHEELRDTLTLTPAPAPTPTLALALTLTLIRSYETP